MHLERDKRYICEARVVLQNTFTKISCAAIDVVLRSSDFNFTAAFGVLRNIESQHAETNRNSVGQYASIPPTIKVFIIKNREKKRKVPTHDLLLTEINTIPELNKKDNSNPPRPDPPSGDMVDCDDKENNLKSDASLVGCLCCYGDYPPTEMEECKAGSGHFVCGGCVYRYVSEQLDGNNSVTFKCIVDADCKCKYSLALLDQVLSPKLNRRVNYCVMQEGMKKAGINSWTCPKCAYIGFIEGKSHWIKCPGCDAKYCTKCNDIYHENQTCQEVRNEKQRLKDPKHCAHEAMSNACKRFCPHCNQEFMKSDGCNKITCRCKGLSCYLCGEKVQDYNHFCNHKLPPGKDKCRCGKCRLFTSTEAMEQLDRNKRQAAGRGVLLEAGITGKEEIRAILASPPKGDLVQKKKKAAAVLHPPVAAAAVGHPQPPQPPRMNGMAPFHMGVAAPDPNDNGRRIGRYRQVIRAQAHPQRGQPEAPAPRNHAAAVANRQPLPELRTPSPVRRIREPVAEDAVPFQPPVAEPAIRRRGREHVIANRPPTPPLRRGGEPVNGIPFAPVPVNDPVNDNVVLVAARRARVTFESMFGILVIFLAVFLGYNIPVHDDFYGCNKWIIFVTVCVALGYDLAEADVTLVMMMMIYVILFWANVLGYVIRNV